MTGRGNLERWTIAKAAREDAAGRIAELFIQGNMKGATEARNEWFAHDDEMERLNRELIDAGKEDNRSDYAKARPFTASAQDMPKSYGGPYLR